MNKIEKQKEHFNNIAQKYFKERQSKTHLLIKKLMWQHFFKDKVYLKIDDQTVLEPMCGYCEGKKIIEDHLGIKIIYEGFDYSDIMVDLAKSNDPCLNVYKMDVTKFQTDKKYDIVIIIGGLHQVVNLNGLQAGDLVFFKTGILGKHVGIYVQGGEFLHASTTKGVMVSNLSDPYWSSHYWKTVRIRN